jgi:hypothetical protein
VTGRVLIFATLILLAPQSAVAERKTRLSPEQIVQARQAAYGLSAGAFGAGN